MSSGSSNQYTQRTSAAATGLILAVDEGTVYRFYCKIRENMHVNPGLTGIDQPTVQLREREREKKRDQRKRE